VAKQRKDDWVTRGRTESLDSQIIRDLDRLSATLLTQSRIEINEMIALRRLRAKQQEFGDP
jgi:hypothetical protein